MLQGDQRVARMQNFQDYLGHLYGEGIYEKQKMEVVTGPAHSASGVVGSSTQGRSALLQGYATDIPTATQHQGASSTALSNGGTLAPSDTLTLRGQATTRDPMSTGSTLYFEIVKEGSFFTAPFNPSLTACSAGTSLTVCTSGVWAAATSQTGTAVTGNLPIPGLTEGNYQWRAVSCDSNNICSDWTDPANTLSFRVVKATTPVDPTDPQTTTDPTVTPDAPNTGRQMMSYSMVFVGAAVIAVVSLIYVGVRKISRNR